MRGKTHWDPKRKRHVQDTPKQSYLAKAVRRFYVNLKDVLSNSQEMKNVCKVAKRCYEKLGNGDFEDCVSRKKFRSLGGGQKAFAAEVRNELFQWFIDVRTSLHAYQRHYSFCKPTKFMKIGYSSTQTRLRKNNSSFKTSGLKFQRRATTKNVFHLYIFYYLDIPKN